MLNKPLNIA